MLVIMSLASWYVLITKLLAQPRMGGQGGGQRELLEGRQRCSRARDTLQPGSPYRYIAESALEATHKHDGLIGKTEKGGDRKGGGGGRGGEAPLVGLFGTVWGIYHALVAIGIAGQASIDKVAGPVGEALIMTAIGLAVAVPAVLGYNWLVRRNKVAMDTVRAFGADLHTVLLAGTAGRRCRLRRSCHGDDRRQEGEDEISTINTTPLVDVMLVLLIIFLITIPVVNSSIAVNLPREQNNSCATQTSRRT